MKGKREFNKRLIDEEEKGCHFMQSDLCLLIQVRHDNLSIIIAIHSLMLPSPKAMNNNK
jgi:hypothetical protein